MFSKSQAALVALSIFAASEQAFARYLILERDGRALNSRSFGHENPAVIQKLGAACPGQVCGNLSGAAITPLLAAQPECSQQDMADQIIDAAQQFDAATKANMIALAIEYRQAEKNTPPDFTTNPPTQRNSVFCQKAPKNAELNGLVQAQDPANDPNVFFDPATGKSVQKGSQANTSPFGGVAASGSAASGSSSSAAAASTGNLAVATSAAASSAAATEPCETVVTVTVTASAAAATSSAAAATATAAASSAIGDFGSCSIPQIEFGVGFDNRKETSFEPVDKTSFNHGSAQNIDIITQFICDTLTNSCGADATAKATCQTARTAADTVTAKTGGQADAFNAVFGITTKFADVASVDDQGNVVAGTGSATASTGSSDNASSGTAAAGSGGIGDFGSCSVPQIEFATGFDNRKETSFQPVDKTSFNHGSAQNIDIITQFICDTLTNSCGADATAKATCQTARSAADTVTAKTGGQADAFNAVFGIKTNFAAVTAVDDQGRAIAGTGSGSTAAAASAAAPATTAAATKAAATTAAATKAAATSAAAAAATSAAAASTAGNLQKFTGALGGVTAPPVTANADGSFQVTGNSSFKDLTNATTRSCDVQHNQCANAANASGNKGDLTVSACGDQQVQCNAAN
ncbi:hypothetical protein TRAPUB_1937 [Trametes pubescens]|uniref:Uncharacterized protein n=1 Tax=Trametes pubescens TaxID=154538 RepID=A0A1M2VI11_TRAPU|nr:hypothetical protein TRAPUB_1937 [Trametes pubescens]